MAYIKVPASDDPLFWTMLYRRKMQDAEVLLGMYSKLKDQSEKNDRANALWAGYRAILNDEWDIVLHAKNAGQLLMLFVKEGKQ